MKCSSLKTIIAFSLITITMTACHKQTENLHQIDLEAISFDADLEHLLNSGKFILQEKTEVNNIPKYYSYNLDSLRYGNITFSGDKYSKYSHSKYGKLDDVFDVNENINRIDIFPSSDGNKILAITLTINNEDEVKELLKYLNRDVQNEKTWSKENKTYILKKETWYIDDAEMTALSISITTNEYYR